MSKHIILLIITLNFGHIFTQTKCCTYPSWGISAGLSQPSSPIVELGIGHNFSYSCGGLTIDSKKYCLWKPFGGFNIHGEYNLIEQIAGVNTGLWFNSLIAFGINCNYYHKNQLDYIGLKPMIGLEIFGVSIYYGYNFKLSGTEIEGINTNTLGVKYYLSLKKKN